MTELPSGPSVPLEYIGVWKRTLLRAPKIEDTTSQVYWMQTQSWHADLRIPANRPACAGRSALDQLTREELLGLALQQGFCGITRVEGNVCRWLREYDYQPPSGANDVGRMVFETPDRMLEYGVEANYFEIWERVPGSRGRSFAVQLSSKPLWMLFAMGRFFISVRPRAGVLPKSKHLAVLATGAEGARLHALLDFDISFGRRGTDTEPWRIELSTLPWMEGGEFHVPGEDPD